MKAFDDWNKQKKGIEERNMSRVYFNEREIWWCILGLNVGREEDGKQIDNNAWFLRPVLLFKKFNGDMIFILPISSKIKTDSYHLKIHFNQQDHCILLSQGRLISTKRLLEKIHKISQEEELVCKKMFLKIFS